MRRGEGRCGAVASTTTLSCACVRARVEQTPLSLPRRPSAIDTNPTTIIIIIIITCAAAFGVIIIVIIIIDSRKSGRKEGRKEARRRSGGGGRGQLDDIVEVDARYQYLYRII